MIDRLGRAAGTANAQMRFANQALGPTAAAS
jgi:hypothetical protein